VYTAPVIKVGWDKKVCKNDESSICLFKALFSCKNRTIVEGKHYHSVFPWYSIPFTNFVVENIASNSTTDWSTVTAVQTDEDDVTIQWYLYIIVPARCTCTLQLHISARAHWTYTLHVHISPAHYRPTCTFNTKRRRSANKLYPKASHAGSNQRKC